MRVDFHAAESRAARRRRPPHRRAARRRPPTPPPPAPSATGSRARSRASPGSSPRSITIRARRWSGSRSSICPARACACSTAAAPSIRSPSKARRVNEAGNVAVSIWRGIPLEDRTTRLTAEIRDADGAVVTILTRPVTFSNVAVRAELVRSRSLLVADGVSRPVLALRLTDSNGRPVHHGLAGDFEVPAPYYPAVEADAQQARQLAGLERARPVWHVEGEDGIAYVELEPTTASGTVTLRFNFRDGELVREQRVEAWLDPGERPWTIVGLAEGTIGFNRLDRNMEALGQDRAATRWSPTAGSRSTPGAGSAAAG